MAAKNNVSVVKRSIFSWILSGDNARYQVLLLITILLTVCLRVVPLEMQKRIVNEAINLRKVDLLFLYCGIYLVAVISASGLKFFISYLQARIGQRTLARIRKALYHHILTLPMNFFRRTQPGMVVSSVVTEIASTGDFAGNAISVPVTSVLTLLAFAGYLLMLNPLLAVISMSIYPVVMMILPRMQRIANRANSDRVMKTRELSDRIAESISGIHEIHGSGAFTIENKKFDDIVDDLEEIRVRWNIYRFGVKVTNNFFNNLSPFLIFIIGGYLAMNGRLELGALVAFLSAQEKLYDPWKEVIEFYQGYQDTIVKYQRTMEYFDETPDFAITALDRKPFALEGDVKVNDLAFSTENGISLLKHINFNLTPGEHMALVGFSGSGKSTLAQCIAQLYKYTSGEILLSDRPVQDLTKQDMTANMGFVPQSPFTFSGTIEENLLYSCRARADAVHGDTDTDLPTRDDVISVLQQTGLFVDVLRFGLNAELKRGVEDDLVDKLISVRKNYQLDYGEELSRYVEFFDESKYLFQSSVAENIILGTSSDPDFDMEQLCHRPYFNRFLKEAGLYRPLQKLGVDLVTRTITILGNLPPDETFFENSPITIDEVDRDKALAERLRKTRLPQLSDDDQHRLLEVSLRFTPGRHKMIVMPELLQSLILDGRAQFRDMVEKDRIDGFQFYEQSRYIYSQSILSNIVFGKTRTTNPAIQERINQIIIQLLIEADLLERITEIGMQFHVGSKGERLSGGQRQKLAIARSMLKSPRLLILDEATSALDNASQARIQNLLETRWKGKSTVISVVHRLDMLRSYDKIAVMKAGEIVEMGTYHELIEKKGIMYELTQQ